MILRFILALAVTALSVNGWTCNVVMCDHTNTNNSQIYCGGDILKAVNEANLFNDSKEFVDMPLKFDPDTTIADFEAEFNGTGKIDPVKLQKFVNDHFYPAGHELEQCVPAGYSPKPGKLMTIVDDSLRDWALNLNNVWSHLCRKVSDNVTLHPELHSLIEVPHEFIIPGGRFREPYYWDAYWIVKGLLASEMYEAAARMLLNYKSYVDRFGFIPNGGRVYYLQRSQPPMYIPMIYEFYEATKNVSFVRKLLASAEAELNFWDTHRTVDVSLPHGDYTLYRYNSASNVPRPEAFKEDMATANATDRQSCDLWSNLATTAETGYDFSTRWFADKKSLVTIETKNVVPVDLNSFICWNLEILTFLFEYVGMDTVKSDQYRQRYITHRRNLQKVFFNETEGAWLDYNLREKAHNPTFYASLAAPLFTNCYEKLDSNKAVQIYDFFKRHKAFEFTSGVPQSTINSSQQWDFPNGWSHVNHMIIEGFRKSNSPQMQEEAFALATKWVRGNYKVFNATKHMYEKYDVVGDIPQPGAGGEYNVQEGFGWSNGVILDLLVTYGDRISVSGGDKTTAAAGAYISSGLGLIALMIPMFLRA
uniref:Trehalase n=1 Tax=Panagrellus redivivus TaxID=6233 RepID=A0A7E4UL98_PANRE